MPFVKLDCGILNSTLWFEREVREVFITALLMAEPLEITEPMPQIAIGSLDYTGWSVPPGWYGFVAAASVGIIHQAQVPQDLGIAALTRLGEPEQSSRSKEFDGRRLVRVDGGFVVLNFMKYRDRDYTAALRSARYRKRKLEKAALDESSRRSVTASHRNITQAEAEADTEEEADRNTTVSVNTKRQKSEKTASLSPAALPERKTNGNPARDPFTDPNVTERAGRFIERYQQLYIDRRNGARYAQKPARDYAAAVTLCQTWPDDDRLDKLAVCFLTTDHKFAEEGSRTIPQFLALASWCDGKLAEWEKAQPKRSAS